MTTAKKPASGYLFGRPFPRPQSRAEQWRAAAVIGTKLTLARKHLAQFGAGSSTWL